MAESKTKQLVFSLYFFLHMKYGYTGLKHPPPFGSLLPVFFSLLAFSSAILRIEPPFTVPRSGEQHQTTIFSPHVRESKTVLDSGFHAMDSGFQVMDSRISNDRIWCPEVPAGFWIPYDVFRVPKPRILESTKKNFSVSGLRISFHEASFRRLFTVPAITTSWQQARMGTVRKVVNNPLC